MKHTVEEAQAFRTALFEAGWKAKKMYNAPEDDSTKLTKDGWVVHIYIQPLWQADRQAEKEYHASISAWGPDNLAVDVPKVFNMAEMEQALRRCGHCGAEGVPTQRIGFAGRVCTNCRNNKELVAKIEFPGWTN